VEFCLSLLELYSICTIIRSSRLDTLTAQHSTAQHSTAQHSTAQHSTAQHRLTDFTAVCVPDCTVRAS
jgi:hypothetical protein